jgi:hypothetical protein
MEDAEILRRLAEGESLREICRAEGLAESTIRLRFKSDETLSAQYARAREAQADHYAEKIVDEAFEAKDPQIGRLRMDALKWAASKLAPKTYGDKVTQEHTGQGGGPIQVITGVPRAGD